MNSNNQDILILFYLGLSPDAQGRKIEDIWQWKHDRLEYTHDYIQWLFPLLEKSNFNRNAPTLNPSIIETFRNTPELKKRLLKSLLLMLNFYGLKLESQPSQEIKIIKGENYQQRKTNWIDWRDHNYLRLTRILTSLRLLGLENEAKALFKCLDEIYQEEKDKIGSETYSYWKNAVGLDNKI
ncbi:MULTISPECIES: opioid growth factor receptor-related protein [Planktothrix]|jgi:Opioid growth factor receptor (OGFr) conserved region|uniref:opioid growth factor receptor-related protein n=1 Tax=Planktothrix TaxID=54304 RepID=UPI0004266C63|nr:MULTISPECIES: opioid growth factor receptor-related protein [Planktothrix]CAD0231133.1 Opioid growth factor receptor (OGFr) conserved region [Planktothrix agardhii]CAD5932862.1 Opioid growth factor receptor [Planktothrix rubescens]CAD5936029.1 Opioid growth factor receptor [Planktothrix agardhii]CAH2572021.1 Opioid growth factor receptor [Planktothrix rubescens]